MIQYLRVAALLAGLGLACAGESTSTNDSAVTSICGGAVNGQTFDGYPAFANDCGDVPIFSTNGKQTNTQGNGYESDTDGYQCVELATRYFHFRWGVDLAGVAKAADLCGIPQQGFSYASQPSRGDLMVFPAFSGSACEATEQWGHVAVVDEVNGSDVSVLQQNVYYGGAWHPTWSGSRSCAACYLHADHNDGTDQPGNATCPAADAGYYICGHDRLSGAIAHTLYYCNGTRAEPVQNCFLGCRVAPLGEDDWCDGTGSSDPSVGTATFSAGSEYDHALKGDWAPGEDKGTCTRGGKPEVPSQALAGLSMNAAKNGKAHDVLCEESGGESMWLAQSCHARSFATSDDRGDSDGGWDWDPGHYKGECSASEYAVGVSQASDGMRSIECCHGNVSHRDCTVRVVDGGDDRSTGSVAADWDPDHWKGECEQGHYMAGVSRGAGGSPHAILCCTP